MASLSKETVRHLAELVGLEIDEGRLETITSRLESVLESIEALDDLALADVEPALTFVPEEAQHG